MTLAFIGAAAVVAGTFYFAGAALAQTAPPPALVAGSESTQTANATTFTPDRVKAHVAFLADDLLEGRAAGTRGHEMAARYVASQFALSGITPAATDGTYFEKVELLETSLQGPPPLLTLATPAGKRSFTHGKDVIIRGATAGGTYSVDAPVVFVGYGMKDERLGVDDYKGLDVRGKVVLVLWGPPKSMDSEIAAHLLNEQVRIAANEGALAVLGVATRAAAAAFPWESVLEFAGEPGTTWVQKDGTPYDPDYGMKVGAILHPDAAASFFDGSSLRLEQVLADADTDAARPRGFPLKADVRIAATTAVRPFSSPNVVGVIHGSDPELKRQHVALVAHLDHIGTKASGTGDRINNGALDNSAGVATLLEVGRAMAAGQRPRRSILLIALTAEEKGLLGADFFARHPTVPVNTLAAAINLDMPLLTYDFQDVVAFGGSHSTLQLAIDEATRQMGITLSPDPMPEQAIFVRSDHYAFVRAGVPAVMLATGMANGGDGAYGKFLSTNYHRPSDDLSQPIVWEAGAKFAELNYRALKILANQPEPTRWYEGDYFGDVFAPKAPKVRKR